MSSRTQDPARRAACARAPLRGALPDEGATARLGAALGRALRAGDAVLLSGGLGAGKSSLARAAIQTRLADLGRSDAVPSPTYTLAQPYALDALTLWHADLYRLGDAGDLDELGFADGLEDGAWLVEWPDRLGALTPPRRLEVALDFAPNGEGRRVAVAAVGGGWRAMLTALGAALRPGEGDPAR